MWNAFIPKVPFPPMMDVVNFRAIQLFRIAPSYNPAPLTAGGSEYKGLSAADLMNCLPAGRRKQMWKFLFHLPHQLAKRAFWARRYLMSIWRYHIGVLHNR
jgi:hypothetical protein